MGKNLKSLELKQEREAVGIITSFHAQNLLKVRRQRAKDVCTFVYTQAEFANTLEISRHNPRTRRQKHSDKISDPSNENVKVLLESLKCRTVNGFGVL